MPVPAAHLHLTVKLPEQNTRLHCTKGAWLRPGWPAQLLPKDSAQDIAMGSAFQPRQGTANLPFPAGSVHRLFNSKACIPAAAAMQSKAAMNKHADFVLWSDCYVQANLHGSRACSQLMMALLWWLIQLEAS